MTEEVLEEDKWDDWSTFFGKDFDYHDTTDLTGTTGGDDMALHPDDW